MRSINKRLAKLEERCGLGPETEEQRHSREWLAEVRRRFAAASVSGGLPPEVPDALRAEDVAGLSIVEILRQRFSRKPVNTTEGSATEGKDTRFPDVR